MAFGSNPADAIRRRITGPAIIGFFIPIGLAIIIALLLHHPQSAPEARTQQAAGTPSSSSDAGTAASTPPTADEVTAANAAILAYCTSDLRQDTSCRLIPNSNVTAPGFVVSGLSMSGQFDPGGASSQGKGLAKGSGSNWTVIWVGQGCIPSDVATKNNVARSLDICAS